MNNKSKDLEEFNWDDFTEKVENKVIIIPKNELSLMDKVKSLRNKYDIKSNKEESFDNSLFDKKGKKKNHIFMSASLEKDTIQDLLKKVSQFNSQAYKLFKNHPGGKKEEFIEKLKETFGVMLLEPKIEKRKLKRVLKEFNDLNKENQSKIFEGIVKLKEKMGLKTTEEVLNILPKEKLNIFIKEIKKDDMILPLKLFQYKNLEDTSKIKIFEEISSLNKKEKEQLKKEFPEMYKKMEEDFNKQENNKF
jgi:hypothetical protein